MSQSGRISGGVLRANIEINENNAGKDFLNFKNSGASTAVLHIDPLTSRIGVNMENPSRPLEAPTKIRTTHLDADTVYLPNFTIDGNITNNIGPTTYIGAATKIVSSSIATADLIIDNQEIKSRLTDSNINLQPGTGGVVNVFNDVNVFGSLNATGNISHAGSLIFGDNLAEDTVAFDVNVNSDLIPDASSTYNLGSPTKRWGSAHINFLRGEAIRAGEITTNVVDGSLRPGNTFYVSINGDDTNVGDHPQGPFRTLTRALQAADSSAGGPVNILITPGEYEEQLPLIIPPMTTVTGADLRNCIILPAAGYTDKDVFLLDDSTGVENLTIKDFFYNSTNNTGHAFRFKSGGAVTSRSPYVRNCTVITAGSVTSVNDPRGYDQGDAGRGAYIDGAELDNASINAALLFHAATFITPGVDAVTMTNGCRVEWLNSFTYFAAKGLRAVRGSVGRTSTDGSTVEYGAELRAIGSANVYGEVGAEADGDGTIMYLINHNFAYIGVGKDITNDATLVDSSQVALQLNTGKIFYSATDQVGKFNVGDDFFIDLDKGITNIDTSNVNFDGLNSLAIQGTNSRTLLSSEAVDTGNLRLAGNTLFSLSGDVNITAATSTTNLQNNVSMKKDLSMTGDFTIDGSLITFGNQFQDTVTFNVDIEQNLNPDDTQEYILGSPSYRWNVAYLSKAELDGIQIFDNQITTKDTNANLELLSNGGSGVVSLENVTFRENTISTYPIPGADSTLADSHLNLDIAGDFLDIQATGFILPNGNTAQQLVDTDDVDLAGGLRFNTQTGLFEGYGDGRITFRGVYSDNQRTKVVAHKTDNTLNFYVNNVEVGEVNAMGLEINGLQSDSILINDNVITTNETNADLELRRTENETIRLNGQEYIRDNIVTNNDTSGAMVLGTTDNGFIKFVGTTGTFLSTSGQISIDDMSVISIATNTVTGSDIFATTAGGVSVQSAGTGIGDNGGFATNAHYLFTSTSDTSIETGTIDLTNFSGASLEGKVIVGTGSNGRQRPENLETLLFQWSDDNTNWQTIGTVASGATAAEQADWTDFEVRVPLDVFGLAIPEANGSIVTSEIGSSSNASNQTFRLNIEDLLGFEPDTATITSIEFRGDFGDNTEYVDVVINGVSYRIGETEDAGDSAVFLPSANGTNIDITSLLTEVNFQTGFEVSVNPSSDISFDTVGIGDWWQLRFNIDATRNEVSTDISQIKFRLFENVTSLDDGDNFGITDLSLRYSTDQSVNPEIGAIRFNIGSKQQEVYNGTIWIPGTGQEEDPVTNEVMEDLGNVFTLMLG
ncbi:MAG: hypothetical protein CMC73_07285 [Flavobacteriaceae bacterium]|nr:hypothetical protein [Flavobacteriaceae bacterium]